MNTGRWVAFCNARPRRRVEVKVPSSRLRRRHQLGAAPPPASPVKLSVYYTVPAVCQKRLIIGSDWFSYSRCARQHPILLKVRFRISIPEMTFSLDVHKGRRLGSRPAIGRGYLSLSIGAAYRLKVFLLFSPRRGDLFVSHFLCERAGAVCIAPPVEYIAIGIFSVGFETFIFGCILPDPQPAQSRASASPVGESSYGMY